ncbi:PrsW family intramembrane metalloprotease [Patescibacteria group bacterium AH-259-L07]|nr:PrsW family intramembrane metalloprotease [Patescibacteria group bacterium AH-259-L07]
MDLLTYLISEITWGKLLLYLLLSGGPALAWLLVCLRLDKSAPEPGMQILKTFVWGVVLTIPLIYIAGAVTGMVKDSPYISAFAAIFVLSFLVDGLFEEGGKYIILRSLVYPSVHFDELRDGFIYGMVLGLGFAFAENVLYGIISDSVLGGAWTVMLRGITTTFLHFLSGGIIGYYIGLVKFHSLKKSIALYGLVLAVILHGLYNTVIRFGWWWNLFPLIILLIGVYIAILIRIKKIAPHPEK